MRDEDGAAAGMWRGCGGGGARGGGGRGGGVQVPDVLGAASLRSRPGPDGDGEGTAQAEKAQSAVRLVTVKRLISRSLLGPLCSTGCVGVLCPCPAIFPFCLMMINPLLRVQCARHRARKIFL